MPSLAFLASVISLGIYLIPVFICGAGHTRAQDYFVRPITRAGCDTKFFNRLCTENGSFRAFRRLGRERRFWPAIISSASLIWFVSDIHPTSANARIYRKRIKSRPIHHVNASPRSGMAMILGPAVASGLTVFARGLIVCETIEWRPY
jgi:hypothetical protein